MSTNATTPRKTLDQRRAAHAWQVIEYIRKQRDDKGQPLYLRLPNPNGTSEATDKGKKLGTQMKKLPTRIMAAGLGQALAFLRAKEDAPVLEQALNDWLHHNRPDQFDPKRSPANSGSTPLITDIIERWSAAKLRQQTEEALAYLPWLSRFAEAAGLMDTEQDHA